MRAPRGAGFGAHARPLPTAAALRPPRPERSGHGSFSNNRELNDFLGNAVHASIMVPYHGWRISHRCGGAG